MKKFIILFGSILIIAVLAICFFLYMNEKAANDPYKELVGIYEYKDDTKTQVEFREDRTGWLMVSSGFVSMKAEFEYEIIENSIIITVTGEVLNGQVFKWKYEITEDILTVYSDEMSRSYKRLK